MAQDKVRAAMRGRGYILPDTIAGETGLSGPDVLGALAMLEIMGEAEESGGRYRLKGDVAPVQGTKGPKKALRAKAGTKRVTVPRRTAPVQATGAGNQKRGEVVGKGKNWTAKRGPGSTRQPHAYPVQVCSTRYKDPVTGKWAPTPASAKPTKPGRAKAQRGTAPAIVTTRRKDATGTVIGARVTDGSSRRAQQRGKLTKAQVRDVEHQLSGDYAEHVGLDVTSERMREAYLSDKAQRGASTRARNKAAGRGPKKRDPVKVRTELLQVEQRLKDAQRRHAGAKTQKTKTRHADSVKRQRARLDKLKRELEAVSR